MIKPPLILWLDSIDVERGEVEPCVSLRPLKKSDIAYVCLRDAAEIAARIVDQRDPEKPSSFAYRRENLAAEIDLQFGMTAQMMQDLAPHEQMARKSISDRE